MKKTDATPNRPGAVAFRIARRLVVAIGYMLCIAVPVVLLLLLYRLLFSEIPTTVFLWLTLTPTALALAVPFMIRTLRGDIALNGHERPDPAKRWLARALLNALWMSAIGAGVLASCTVLFPVLQFTGMSPPETLFLMAALLAMILLSVCVISHWMEAHASPGRDGTLY